MKRNVLGLLAKYPEPGLVKTRLASVVGVGRAADIYKTVAEKVFRQTRPGRGEYERVIFYSPLWGEGRFEDWLPGEDLRPQRGDDIGEIMASALGDLLSSGATAAVIAGVDIPDLERGIVRDAFAALEGRDIVIGPALDGGYYLIGMKSLRHEIFQCVSWSTEKVFHETVGTIERLGLRYSTVTPLSDLDRMEDIRKFEDLLS
jgi:rSAM/selenodomain-associated transferase 1